MSTLAKYEDYRVIVCGHSMGAAVGTLFTLLFHTGILIIENRVICADFYYRTP